MDRDGGHAMWCSPTRTTPTPGSCWPTPWRSWVIDWVFTDLGRTYRTEMSSGALIHSDAEYGMGEPGLTITLVKPQLIGVIGTGKLDARGR